MNYTFLDSKALLRKYGLRPRKSLGQNFLVDPSGLRKVMEAAQVGPTDEVLEIGAGLGSLTVLLAQTAAAVKAVEVDGNLIAPLHEALSPYTNVNVVEGDMLALNPDDLMPHAGYLVVANIPYYITSALIRHLLEASRKPARITLTMQKEVAERITARDGKMSLLALSVQVYGEARLAAVIPAGCFYPAPDVDSAVITIALHHQPLIPTEALDDFFSLARAGFSQKRKTLRNALSGGLGVAASQTADLLVKAEINPERRAETLTIAEWQRLTEAWRQMKG